MSEEKETILIIEDDASILSGLSLNLRYEGFRVLTSRDGKEGLTAALEKGPELVLLDVMLPGMNGFEVLRELRRRGSTAGVLMLSAKGQETDKVMGLDLGADDYVAKPFGLPELLARMKAVLRRRQADPRKFVVFGDVEVDLEGQRVTRGAKEVPLTPQELKLLRYFVEREGRALTRDVLLAGAWSSEYEGTPRTVDNFVQRLRAKLEVDPDEPRHFTTVRGVGYRFVRR